MFFQISRLICFCFDLPKFVQFNSWLLPKLALYNFPFFARLARNVIKWDFLRWFSNIVILLRLAFASLLCMCNFGNKFGRRRRETMRTKCWLYNNTSTAKLLLLWTNESKKKKRTRKRAAKKALSSFYSMVITYHSCWLVSFLLFTPT